MQFLERPDDIPNLFDIIVGCADNAKTCNSWEVDAATGLYKQIDSGLKIREVVGHVELLTEVLEKFSERRRDEAEVTFRQARQEPAQPLEHTSCLSATATDMHRIRLQITLGYSIQETRDSRSY